MDAARAQAEESARVANEMMNGHLNWRFEIVDIENVHFDTYQRKLRQRWLKARKGKLDPALLGTVLLSDRPKRGKDYACWDGQHRIELCRMHGQTWVAAVVYTGMTQEEEAIYFARYQDERQNVSPLERFNAKLIGKDEKSLAIDKMLREEGFSFDEQEGAGRIRGVRAIQSIYDADPSLLRMVLRLSRETWNGSAYATNERVLRGLSLFLRANPDVDESRFVDRVGRAKPSEIIRNASMLREARSAGGTLPKYIMEAIENEYRRR
jgi:hypothetical protein